MAQRINKNFFIVVILFGAWIFPLLQSKFKLIPIEELGGVSKSATDTTLSAYNWFDGSYAEQKQSYLNDNFGFRELAIRTHNQIEYSLYKKANIKDVIVGKDNFLFEAKYIRAYYGVDYVGEKKLNEKIRKLKFVQDTLKKLNKTFIFLIAPNKASFYPEYVPDKYKGDSSTSNYITFKSLLIQDKVNYIDYDLMFRNLKTQIAYPLYPVAGTHWTEYGVYIALDSLTNYIEKNTNFILPKLDYAHDIKVSNAYIGADNDMGKAMNLLIAPDYGKLAYPKVVVNTPPNVNQPNVLMVADSYWMRIYFTLLPKSLYKTHSFWYYYNLSYDYNNGTDFKNPCDLNLKDELMKKDVICIMSTGANLKSIGWHFIEDCYDLFKNGKIDENARLREMKIEHNRLNLWDDNVAFRDMQIASARGKISIDSAVTSMATYLYDVSH